MDERSGITLEKLKFTGAHVKTVGLDFRRDFNVLWGASNTGKSFAVKSIDFMLGSSKTLPDIGERAGYEQAWLVADLPKSGLTTLERALAGGAFDVFSGEILSRSQAGANVRTLSARHDSNNTDNLSQLLLEDIGFGREKIAIDANGKQRSLSFRDLIRYCIVDEVAIQSDVSPAYSGQHQSATAERSVFKLLITGVDDSAIVPVLDKKTFQATTAGKIEVIDEFLLALDEELSIDFPNSALLVEQQQDLELQWHEARTHLAGAEESIRSLLARKRLLADGIATLESRQSEILISLVRFAQLEQVYVSDIDRLQAIEEAGFLLALGGEQDCPLCGASPESQRHSHGLEEIDKTRAAVEAEVAKIRLHQSDLQKTRSDLESEEGAARNELSALYQALGEVEERLQVLMPVLDRARQRAEQILPLRDRVLKGLDLIARREVLQMRRNELVAVKPAARGERPKMGVPSRALHEFAHVMSEVLREWQFPGRRVVSFDETTFDVRIDGKRRSDNGKGVRAITHAAFKVAVLLFCRERNLPHPGFLILDTPLLTYRDPITSKAGPLATDEQELSNTSLKDFFFEHMYNVATNNQVLVVENVLLPPVAYQVAQVQTLSGDVSSGRAGLFH